MKRTRLAQILGGLSLIASSRMLWAVPWWKKAFAVFASLALITTPGGETMRRYDDEGRDAALAVWTCHGVNLEPGDLSRLVARGWLRTETDAAFEQSCAEFQTGVMDPKSKVAQELARFKASQRAESEFTPGQMKLLGEGLIMLLGPGVAPSERDCYYYHSPADRQWTCREHQITDAIKAAQAIKKVLTWEQKHVLTEAGFMRHDGTPNQERLQDLRDLERCLQQGGCYTNPYLELDPDLKFVEAMRRALLDDPTRPAMVTSWTGRG